MKRFLFLFCLLLFTSCITDENRAYTFYYWRTHLSLDSTEQHALQKATTPYIYTRFFDIEKVGGRFQPVAVLTKDPSFRTEKKIVPVVFIKNDVFYDITLEEINFLAKNILTLIQRKQQELGLGKSGEIQIDCDWTAGTNKEYFTFLERLKEYSGKKITCTLRLHQVKDRTLSGVPPVEKVYLMCYATSSPLENSAQNSILHLPTLRNYLKNIGKYPLDVDVALPIYSWGIVTNHLGRHKLINALSVEDLVRPGLRKTSENTAEVLTDGFYFGNYLTRGFKLKVETIPPNELRELKKFLSAKLWNYSIVYYHLDSKFVNHYDF